MPGDSRNTSVLSTARRHGVDAFPRFGVEDLQAVTAAPGLIAGTTDEPTVKAPAEVPDIPTVLARDSSTADPVGGVPKGDESIAATNGEIPGCGGERDRETGGRVSVEGVQGIK